MQADRSAAVARTAGTVRGLGVCDVLRVELSPEQRSGLDAQMAVRAAALEQRLAALQDKAPRRGDAPDDDAERRGVSEELRLLGRMRAALPAHACDSFVFVGPAGLVFDPVHAW